MHVFYGVMEAPGQAHRQSAAIECIHMTVRRDRGQSHGFRVNQRFVPTQLSNPLFSPLDKSYKL
jgi:hypothetical protein